MSDPRKGHAPLSGKAPRHSFTAKKLGKICRILEADFSASPEIDKAAKRLSASIRKGTTPERIDLAAVMMELLSQRANAADRRKKRQMKKAFHKPEPKVATRSKATGTSFSKRMEVSDRKSRGSRLRRRLHIKPADEDDDGTFLLTGDSP